MIEKYLMSFDEYNKVDHPVPYSYFIEKGPQCLYYFGANHSADPKDPQYDMIKAFWNEFLAKTEGQDRIVFVEGGKRIVRVSEEDAIHKGSESSFITYLASKENIETFSPEPPEKFRFEELEKKFTRDEIMYYEFARIAHQWNRLLQKPDFDTYVGGSLKHDKENSGWKDFDASIGHMIEIQKNIFGREFNKNDMKFFYDAINPTTSASRINELSRFEDSGFRDGYILRQIEKYWNEGKSLFIVYGCSHAVMHEKAVKSLIEK